MQKRQKFEWDKNLKVMVWILEGKGKKLQGFQIFNFALYPKPKTWKSRKVLFDFKF